MRKLGSSWTVVMLLVSFGPWMSAAILQLFSYISNGFHRGQQFWGKCGASGDHIPDWIPQTTSRQSCIWSQFWWNATVYRSNLKVRCGVCAVTETWSPRTCSSMRRTTSASLTLAWPPYRWETACWRPAVGEHLCAERWLKSLMKTKILTLHFRKLAT